MQLCLFSTTLNGGVAACTGGTQPNAAARPHPATGDESGGLPRHGRPLMGKFSACAPPQKCRRVIASITMRFPIARCIGKFVFTVVRRSSPALVASGLLPSSVGLGFPLSGDPLLALAPLSLLQSSVARDS